MGNVTPGVSAQVDPGTTVRMAHTVKGIIAYAQWVLPRALDFLARRRHVYPFEQLISHTLPFRDINAAFACASSGQALRVSLTV